MNYAHLHVALNHFPIVAVIVGTIILLFGLFGKNYTVQRVALWVFIGVAAIGIPTLLTGMQAEDILKEVPGVAEADIEAHEKIAMISFWGLAALALLSAIQLYRMKKQPGGALIYLIALLAVVASGLAGYTANLGGKIRHSEFENNPVERHDNDKSGKDEDKSDKKDKTY